MTQKQKQKQSTEKNNNQRGLTPGIPGFPGGQPGGPPGPGPGGFPPMPGGGGPGGPGGGQGPGAPQSPPPSFIPQQSASLFAVDPGSISRCLFRNVYIWQDNGDQYWMYLTHVGRNSISGYRWYGFGPTGFWLYFGLDLRRINQFTCF
ncbi:collagen-like protein [Paenibacillus radicis (ex Xue et al. 2023)]|uniref:collagen-like protein n=1 Tax=Paenibacillus radicis (ex Xue et al. 2023) TaxID=2972489 RepID=UPI003AF31C3D